jgi:hypothetical protein
VVDAQKVDFLEAHVYRELDVGEGDGKAVRNDNVRVFADKGRGATVSVYVKTIVFANTIQRWFRVPRLAAQISQKLVFNVRRDKAFTYITISVFIGARVKNGSPLGFIKQGKYFIRGKRVFVYYFIQIFKA